MKLNSKRTILVGFAFFLICTFWQAYDTVVPKILTDHFGLPQMWSGVIMALDNIFALFMLPLFGSLSDKTSTKIGKRKPFIIAGTVIAIVAFVLLSVSDISQLRAIGTVGKIDDPTALSVVYDSQSEKELQSPDGEKYKLTELFTEEQFTGLKSDIYETVVSAKVFEYTDIDGAKHTVESDYKKHIVTQDGSRFFFRDRDSVGDTEIMPVITANGAEVDLALLFGGELSSVSGATQFAKVTNSVYTNYVAPARQAYIHELTRQNPSGMIKFVLILLVVLVAMSTFRSPAVALMPDITVKPLRSKANAVINLMGTFGGMCVLVLGMGFAFNNSAITNTFRPYLPFFLCVGGIMAAALIVFTVTVKEPKWSDEMNKESKALGIDTADDDNENAGSRKLSRGEFKSLIFILASVALWYFGYNAVTSKYSVYATNVLDIDYSTTLLIANAAAVVSYIPVGIIASKVGRKKTILAGVTMLTCAFGVACFMRVGSSPVIMNAMFALAGIAWATINVNSFPMVVELSRGGDIGRYTGFYYAASMAAQALTPFISGVFMDKLGMTTLFPYATVFVALAFVTMLFVRHGDSKPVRTGK